MIGDRVIGGFATSGLLVGGREGVNLDCRALVLGSPRELRLLVIQGLTELHPGTGDVRGAPEPGVGELSTRGAGPVELLSSGVSGMWRSSSSKGDLERTLRSESERRCGLEVSRSGEYL